MDLKKLNIEIKNNCNTSTEQNTIRSENKQTKKRSSWNVTQKAALSIENNNTADKKQQRFTVTLLHQLPPLSFSTPVLTEQDPALLVWPHFFQAFCKRNTLNPNRLRPAISCSEAWNWGLQKYSCKRTPGSNFLFISVWGHFHHVCTFFFFPVAHWWNSPSTTGQVLGEKG